MSDLFLTVMFMRLFFLYRSVLNYSIFTDAVSKKMCNQHGFNNSMKFALKCMLNLYPATVVFSTFLIVIFIAAYLLRVFELPLVQT